MIMLSLVHPCLNECMHILFSFLVATATFCALPGFARPPSPSFEFQERPSLKQLLIEPEFSNLFSSTPNKAVPQASPFSFTGISSSGETLIAHYIHDKIHSYARVGQLLPDGSKLISIDIHRRNITTNRDQLYTTYTLKRYD